jgi:dTDP-4-dehydrorhamnose reductase
MKLLITGSSGMLGRALCQVFADKNEVTGMDIVKLTAQSSKLDGFIECDITDRASIIAEIISARPDIVIHAAAYTDVDGCENAPREANRINASGTENVALACKESGCLLVYLSTDFVFDGKKDSAYTEEDLPHPINVYGRSKLEGERLIRSILDKFVIIRSGWLFGEEGRSFLDTFLKKAQQQESIEVVDDQFGSPTYVRDLAHGIAKLLTLAPADIYHISNGGSCSWYEFARAIKEIANLRVEVLPVSSGQYPTPTRRPRMSILDNRRYQQYSKDRLRLWQDALKEYLAR